MAKKVVDKRKQKEKKERIFLGVAAVLLVGLLAIQGPKLMGGKKGSAASPATTSALTTYGTGTVFTDTNVPPQGGEVASPPESFAAGPGQLASLRLFAPKDPFAQQMGGGGTSSTSTSGSSTSGSSTGRSTTTPTTTTRTTSRTTSSTPTTTEPSSPYLSAVITVNGVAEGVNVSQAFPLSSPVFVLMSVSKSSVMVGIAGGQLSSGAKGVTLKKGQSVTLVNTADGRRYVVVLMSVSTRAAEITTTAATTTAVAGPPGPVPPSTTTSPTTTTGSTTTATTTTTG